MQKNPQPMNAQIKKDRDLVIKLITDREKYQPLFVRRFRERIYQTIDSKNEKLDKHSVISVEQKKSLLNDFLDFLYLKDARNLRAYLKPERLKMQNNGEERISFTLTSSSSISNDLEKKDQKTYPSLDKWVDEKSGKFINSKLIIKGILEKNANVIESFVIKTSYPSCFSIISGMVWEFKDKTIMEPNDVAQEFALALLKDEQLRNRFKEYRYEMEFYEYFKLFIFRDFFKKVCLKKIINPVYPSGIIAKERQDEVIESISIETGMGKDEVIKLSKKSDFSSIPPQKVIPQEITDSINERITLSEYDYRSSKKFDDEHYQYLIERVFGMMSQSASGRKQVEILKTLQFYQGSGMELKDKEIAEILGMSVSDFSKKKKKAQKEAKRTAQKLGIAKELGINSLDN